MGGHSSGPSAYEIQAQQKAAEEAEAKRQKEWAARQTAAANASSGGEGDGEPKESVLEGALSKGKKKGATLAGEGAQTFGANGNLGG